MSNWIGKYRHKPSGEVHEVYAMNGYFGGHTYGYKVLSTGKIIHEDTFCKEWEVVKDE